MLQKGKVTTKNLKNVIEFQVNRKFLYKNSKTDYNVENPSSHEN